MPQLEVPPSIASEEPEVPQRWWLYSSWIERAHEQSLHLYGFLVPIGRAVPPSSQCYLLPSGATLRVSQIGFDNANLAGQTLLASIVQGAGEVHLCTLLEGAPFVKVRYSREVLVPFPGHSAARAKTLYGMPNAPSELPADADLVESIRKVATGTGVDLRGLQVTHLGGFDLFKLSERLEAPCDFRVVLSRSDDRNHNSILSIWRIDGARAKWSAHVRAKGDGEVLWDGLNFPCTESLSIELTVQGIVDETNVSIFDEGGTLLHREEVTYIRDVGITSTTLGRTLEMRDQLTIQAESRGKHHAYASGSVATTKWTSVASYDPDGLRRFRLRIQDHLGHIDGPRSADRWFSRGLDEQLGVIAYFNELLNDGDVVSAVIVDPFFGPKAMETLLPRLSSDALQLTVVSCWGQTELDTAKPLSQQDLNDERMIKRDLPLLLGRLGPDLSVSLRFVNLVTGGGGPAFHDRYLLLRDRVGRRQVYLLSNSINNLAVNWPFCMSQLSGDALNEAVTYIEGLCLGNDATKSTTTRINFEWPSATAPGA